MFQATIIGVLISGICLLAHQTPVSSGSPIAFSSSVAGILIEKATDANVKAGDLISVGGVIRTNKTRFENRRFYKGGEVEGSFREWGISNFLLYKGSTLQLKSYGYCFGGGRVAELKVTGEALIKTRRMTHACSDVKVCMGELGKGCASLKSSIKLREYKPESYVVGVVEGRISAQDVAQKNKPVLVNAGYYSFSAPDGSFSLPQSVKSEAGYRLLTQTKTVRSLQAMPGYRFLENNREIPTLQSLVGIPFKLLSPLD